MFEFGPMLQQLREASGYTQIEVADMLTEKSGKTVSFRVVSNWETGITEIKGQSFVHLMQLYGVRDLKPYFFPDDAGVRLTQEDYDKITEFIRFITYCRRNEGYPESEAEPAGTIPLFDTPAAAGPGQYLDGSTATKISRTSAVPAAADFAVWVRGDSMEPIVYDGQIAWVHQQRVLDDGEIGVFSHNGEGKIKKLAREGDDVYLVSANSQYEPLPVLPDDELTVFGRVVGFCCPELISM